ncbi:MAG: lysophospholipid acyltransferase family protein, partial [Chitinophagaceae bacterium]
IFGFIYKVAVVTVNRSDAEHRAKSVQVLKTVLAKNISIALAPEGTFNMEPVALAHFYDGAFRISIETQTPIKPLLFIDTYDRMHHGSLFSLKPGRLRTVYLEAISPAGYTLETVEEFKQHVYQIMEQKLIAYKASWIDPNYTLASS